MLSEKQIARYRQHVKDGTWTEATVRRLQEAGKITEEEAARILEG